MFPVAVHYAHSHPLTPSSASRAGEQYREKGHATASEGGGSSTPLRFDSTTQHASPMDTYSEGAHSGGREYRNKDVVIRLVEMAGSRGVCALALHPHLMARVQQAWYAYMDESTYGKKRIRKIRPRQLSGVDVRGKGQSYLEIAYEPYKIITVRLIVE